MQLMNLPLVLFAAVTVLLCDITPCPENCRCIDDNTKVICMDILTLTTAELPLTTEKFILTGNHMVEFPAQAFRHLKQLKSLGLTFNKLNFIPTKLSIYFPKLKEFFLTGNEIEEVRPLYGLDTVEILNLDNNKIKRIIPGCFTKMKNLKELSLQGNELIELPKNIFSGLQKLKKIDLSDNKIKRVNKYVFNTLSNVTEINLSRNELLTIQRHTFSTMKRLRSIHLSKNNILKVSEKAFDNITIDMIDLRFNKLDKVSISSLRHLSIKGKIYMDGNPITCDCSLYKLLQNELKCYFRNRQLIFGHCASKDLLLSAETLQLVYKDMNCDENNRTIKCSSNYVDYMQHQSDDDLRDNKEEMSSSSPSGSGPGIVEIINSHGMIILIMVMSLVAFALCVNLLILGVKTRVSLEEAKKQKQCGLLIQTENKEEVT